MATPPGCLFQRNNTDTHTHKHTHIHKDKHTAPLPWTHTTVKKSITRRLQPRHWGQVERSRLGVGGHFLLESGRKISMSGVACCCCCCCCCCFMAALFSASIFFLASSRALVAERIFCACSGEESGVSLLLALRPLRLEPGNKEHHGQSLLQPKHDA